MEGSSMTEAYERLHALEDGFTERKLEGANAAELRRTLVAFANAVPEGRTAILYVGVGNDGKIVGVAKTDSCQKTIRRIAEKECYPPIDVTSEVVSVSGKNVVAVHVRPSTKRPHFAGLAYIRHGSESVEASEELYEELIASRNTTAGAILRLKDQIVTVIAEKKELGSTKYLGDSAYRARHECKVLGCTGHYVRLEDISSFRHLTEPLANVTVMYDEDRHRPMLLVQPG